ncbi:MAG TPA: molybdate ABC transporter permease subunit [Planctomycetota bacterium]|nr:molybdate ABC transporter permease subunit [Planctomycetota bacterium]
MSDAELLWQALGVSLRVAASATLLAAGPALALGWLLARREFRGKTLVETLVALPLVLPPTAVGYLLLRAFGRGGPLAREVLGFDPDVLLSFRGAVLAAAVMSLPLIARAARAAFEGVPARLETMARTLGWSRSRVFLGLTVPLARAGLSAALVLGFGRALGEFGATIVVAGNLPGRTQTLSLAIFDAIQVGAGERALAAIALSGALAFALVAAVELLERRARRSA